MAFDLNRIRSDRFLYIVAGMLLMYWGWTTGTVSGAILTGRYQIGLIMLYGGAGLTGYGFARLIRRGGDDDDWQETKDKPDDDSSNDRGNML